MSKKKHSAFRGYLQTVVCGLAVIAGVLFMALQHPPDLVSKVSIFGRYTDVRTVWVLIFAALGGPVFLLCCWWLIQGIGILRTARRAEKQQQAQAAKAVSQAKKELQEAVGSSAPAAPAPQPTPGPEPEPEPEPESGPGSESST